MKYRLILILSLLVFFFSCSVSKQISKSAKDNVLKNDALQTAHVGISIYEPLTGKYWYNYQADNYFVPASNTKLPTCYAAMKYLGDSLVGLRYTVYNDGSITVQSTGDPTFLHPDFKKQPVYSFLNSVKDPINVIPSHWQEMPWGRGWNWDDLLEAYAPERSEFPIYGNVARFYLVNDTLSVIPNFLLNRNYSSILHVNEHRTTNEFLRSKKFSMQRSFDSNYFYLSSSSSSFKYSEIPFRTNIPPVITEKEIKDQNASLADKIPYAFLEDTLHKKFAYKICVDKCFEKYSIIHSQPTASLLKPMMHRSDNFFAEQTLLMVSNELLGVMNDEKIIDTLLKTDFKNLPQKPRWVDGSGLSRYNLFTPQDFVFILNKMKNDFGMERIKTILPTGNEGTLEGRFAMDSNYIFAKTGTLSGVVSLSGFLYTKKNKLLIFSVLVNNHNSSAGEIRRAVERFVEGIREKY